MNFGGTLFSPLHQHRVYAQYIEAMMVINCQNAKEQRKIVWGKSVKEIFTREARVNQGFKEVVKLKN